MPTAWTAVTSAATGRATLAGSGWTPRRSGHGDDDGRSQYADFGAADRAGYGVAPRYGQA